MLLWGIKMDIIKNYKNIFLNPRQFANDKLTDSWSWWVYALILVVLSVASSVVLGLATSILSFKLIFSSLVSGTLFVFFFIFLTNVFFKEDLSWSKIFSVLLSLNVYISALFGVLMGSTMLLLHTENDLFMISGFLLSILSLVFIIWYIVSYIRIVSELHDVSVGKVFLALIFTGVIMSVLNIVLVFLQLGAL